MYLPLQDKMDVELKLTTGWPMLEVGFGDGKVR